MTWPLVMVVYGRENPMTIAPRIPTSSYVPGMGRLNVRSVTSAKVRSIIAVRAVTATAHMTREIDVIAVMKSFIVPLPDE